MKGNISFHEFSGKEVETLLAAAVKGDSASFDKLSGIIRSVSYSYFKLKYNIGKIKNLDEADDLAHNVFLAFAKQYQNIDNIENWLRRVLFLTFVNWYKKQKRRTHLELNENLAAESETDVFENSVDSLKILRLTESLSETKRQIIRLRFWENMKFSEIAERTGKNEAAVKKMLYRTLEEIKNKLE